MKSPTTHAVCTILLTALIANAACREVNGVDPGTQSTAVECNAGPLVTLTFTENAMDASAWHSPRFVLYGDGTVIYSRPESPGQEFMTTRLDSAEMATLVASLELSSLEPLDGMRFVSGPSIDVPEYELAFCRRSSRRAEVTVAGWGWKPMPDSRLEPPPDVVDRALRALTEFTPGTLNLGVRGESGSTCGKRLEGTAASRWLGGRRMCRPSRR
jgi:hypothetical protein